MINAIQNLFLMCQNGKKGGGGRLPTVIMHGKQNDFV